MIEVAHNQFLPGPLYPDLFGGDTPIMVPAEAVCLECGRLGGDDVAWGEVNYELGLGLCEQCFWYMDSDYSGLIGRWDQVVKGRARCKFHGPNVLLSIDTPRERIVVFWCPDCLYELEYPGETR